MDLGPVQLMVIGFDHRVIDGAIGAKFLLTVKRYFENPLLLVI